MSTDVIVKTNQSFEDRIYEKIRTDIGSLMTDAELKKLVETAIERMFFKERIIKDGNYSAYQKTLPPLIQEITQKAVEKQISTHVERYIADHADVFKSIMEVTLKEGFLKIAINTFDNLTKPAMVEFQSQLFVLIDNLRKSGVQIPY